MPNYFANLPAYKNPDNAELNFNPLNQAVQNFGETSRANAMAEYAAGRNKIADGRAASAESRAQSKFNEEKGKEALNQLAGIYQAIEQSPEAERASMYERVRPMYSKLRTQIPDFDADIAAMQIDPNDHVAVGKLIMGRAAGYQDPRKVAEAPSNVREWDHFNRLTPEQQQQYLTMKRADKYLDTGTEYVRPNPVAPGQNVSVVPKNVAGKAAQEQLGEAQGKATADIPRIEANADRALQTIDQIRKHPGKKYGLGITAATGYLPATEARGFTNLVDQAKGQTFLEAFNSLRGGGQITEAEGAKATQALARLDRYQNEADFDAALKDLEDVVRKGLDVARRKAGPATATPPSSGGWGYIGPAP
jgi:hypothetical protein